MGIEVSLCMIARNEEDCLADCIRSVRNLVGEIIVVDTGSSDKTSEIAARSGARVFSLAWNNDFADARNYALKQATKAWILVLDADEIMSPVEHNTWAGLLANPDVEGYFVDICNYLGDGRETAEDFVVRLFRNKPAYRFSGSIHEQVAGAIKTCTEGKGLASSNLVIHHFGYLSRRIEAKDKHKRNTAVIKKALAQTPRDPFLLYCLGIEYFQANDYHRGVTVLTKALTLMKGGEGYFRDALITLGMGLLRSGQIDKLGSHLESCLRMLPDDPDIHLQKGLWALDQERPEEAAEHFSLALDRNSQTVPRGQVLRLLGTACVISGRYGEAGQAYLTALTETPQQLYPLTQILGLKQQSRAGPCWEELSRFASLDDKLSMTAQMVKLGEMPLALVLLLLAVTDAAASCESTVTAICCRRLQRLLSLHEPTTDVQKTVCEYLRVSTAEILLMAETGSRNASHDILHLQQAALQIAAGNLELVVRELCPLWATIPNLEGVVV